MRDIGRDLTAPLSAEDRYARLLDAVTRAVPADAACLLRREGDALVPLAARGLRPAALTRTYPRDAYPRLDLVLRSTEPVHFPVDSPLPEPFDGDLLAQTTPLVTVHSCIGCPLMEGDEVIGALTLDALALDAFDGLEPAFLSALAALAGAALRTSVLVDALERRAERRRAATRDVAAIEVAGDAHLLGTSAAMGRLLREIRIVGASDLAVLVTGETGVGKELVARAIHAASARHRAPLVHVNCAALPESIAESELFGHVAGAFTGAQRERAGKFEAADGGTLFLDEVGEMPLSVQPKLLRALQHGEVQRVGSDRLHRVDVRVIAATNRDLEREVERGRFRADLFHRLAAFPLRVPALRERREDVPVLATHFAEIARRRLGVGPVRFTEEAMAHLLEADWPGNVRELENAVGRAVLRAGHAEAPGAPVRVGIEHFDEAPGMRDSAPPSSFTRAVLWEGSLRERTAQFQRTAIREALARHGGVWAAAARDLGMHRSNLYHLATRLGLTPNADRQSARPHAPFGASSDSPGASRRRS
nr:MAG: nitric oxide reductase transcriptional regulator NorR [Pseudomonadota bacterium]